MKSTKAETPPEEQVSQSCLRPPLSRAPRSKRTPQSWTHRYVIRRRDIEVWLDLLFSSTYHERMVRLLDIRGKYTPEALETAAAIRWQVLLKRESARLPREPSCSEYAVRDSARRRDVAGRMKIVEVGVREVEGTHSRHDSSASAP